MTSFERGASLARLGRDRFDVLVVGGGVTGCGVALDAAARGLSVALVEKDDLASGTSSKSSKLVHGGLRYLQQKELALVYENLRERQRLLGNAPHLVRVVPFLIPVFGRGGVADTAFAKAISTALWLYDLTGGWRVGRLHKRISRQEALGHLPTLRTDTLVDAFLYYDAQTDDARLTLTLARTAALDHGACVVNHARVVALTRDAEGRADGAVLAGDRCDGTVVRARCVVSATGVWADDLHAMDGGGLARTIRPAKGVHLTVPAAALPCDVAAVVTAADKRSIFVVPWSAGEGGVPLTYLGTTDTDYDGPLDDPQCTEADVAYVLETINRWISRPLTAADVVGTWAGLRPLLVGEGHGTKTKDLSRRHKVSTSPAGVVTIGGGKLTTYRKMAQDTVDEVVARLADGPRRCPTRRLALRGAPGLDEAARARLGLAPPVAAHLAGRYGTEARVVAALVAADPGLGRPIVAGLPDLRAEVVHAARHEMATTVDDVLARRTRLRLQARDASAAAADDVAALLAAELGWDAAETAAQAAAYRAAVEHERTAAGLPATALPPLQAGAPVARRTPAPDGSGVAGG
ncbi:MAG: glycerol-3-phosphate dehydrogenase/oxidase [Acidimicrobiales bacterium]